jgi:hypothetical protein
VTTNLRVSLTILTLGFGIEGGGELYSFLSGGKFHPGISFLFVLPVAMTLAGLLFVWIGQHEWNALHRERVRRAHLVFGLSLLGAVVGGAVVAVIVLVPTLGSPGWARATFGAAVGSLVLGTFVTYALLVFHLVPRPSKALLLASLGWAFLVSAFVGAAMAANLPAIVALAAHRTFSVPSFIAPVDSLASYLFVSYFLLLAAYVDAHRTVLQGPSAASPATVAKAAVADPPGREGSA